MPEEKEAQEKTVPQGDALSQAIEELAAVSDSGVEESEESTDATGESLEQGRIEALETEVAHLNAQLSQQNSQTRSDMATFVDLVNKQFAAFQAEIRSLKAKVAELESEPYVQETVPTSNVSMSASPIPPSGMSSPKRKDLDAQFLDDVDNNVVGNFLSRNRIGQGS